MFYHSLSSYITTLHHFFDVYNPIEHKFSVLQCVLLTLCALVLSTLSWWNFQSKYSRYWHSNYNGQRRCIKAVMLLIINRFIILLFLRFEGISSILLCYIKISLIHAKIQWKPSSIIEKFCEDIDSKFAIIFLTGICNFVLLTFIAIWLIKLNISDRPRSFLSFVICELTCEFKYIVKGNW